MVHFGATEVFTIAGIPVTSTVVYTWIIIAVLLIVILLATRRLAAFHYVQNALELMMEALVFFIEDTIPGRSRTFLPIIGTLAIFILSANLSSLFPGMKAPTSDLSTTVALSLIVLGSVHYFGITTKGLRGHLRRYFLPHWAFLPLNIIEELSRPLSLSLRLFGNILGEEVLIVILLSIVPLIIPVPVMALTILTGSIQAFIFTLLALTYISDATEEHH